MKRLFILAAVAAIALTSCQQEQDVNGNGSTLGGKNSVSFVMQGGASTRAGEVNSPVTEGFSTKVGQVDGVNIFLEETIEDLAFSAPETRGTPLYTENLGYLYRDKLGVHTSTYTGGDVVYQQNGDNMVDGKYWCYGYEYPTNIWGNQETPVDFAFYMPANMTSNGVTPTFSGNATTFTYVSPETAVKTQDIVFGGVTKTFKEYHSDYAKYGGTKVKLYHALTGIKFAIANPKKNGKLEYDIQITKISFIGLANGGTCTFTPGTDSGDVNWTEITTEDGNVIYQTFEARDLVDYDKNNNTGHFASSYFDGGTSQNINDAQATKTFWMVPQSITDSDATLKIEFKMSGKDQYMEIRLGDLHSSTWEPAQIRTYTFKLDEVQVKIEDTITMADASTQQIDTPWGKKNITSYAGSTKQDVVITNTSNVDVFIRAAIIGQWRDVNDNPVFGYTDFTYGIQLVDSWYEDLFVTHADTHVGEQGAFEGLPGTKWVEGSDGYYYYTEAVAPGQAVPNNLFTKYTVGKAPGAAIAGKVQEIYFTLEIATQAISAKKLDGTNYTYTEAWTRANSFDD